MIRYNILALAVLLFVLKGYSQENRNASLLKVFLDCNYCDMEYIKQEISFVQFVRDSKQSDIHVLVSVERTGGGGLNYGFYFIGQKKFVGRNDTLSFAEKADATDDESREGYTKILKVGLIPYLAKSGKLDAVNITNNVVNQEQDEVVNDPWNSWVFRISADGYFNGESSYKYTSLYGSVNASRVTEQMRLQFRYNQNYSQSDYSGEDYSYKSVTRSNNFSHILFLSINDHWSAGYISRIRKSTYSNLDLKVSFAPTIEYNIFPYSESSRKEIRLGAEIHAIFNDYTEKTLYDKTEEYLYMNRLSINGKTQQKWGTISSRIAYSYYLHDFAYNNLSFYNRIEWRIVKGLSLYLSGRISIVRDQLSLVAGEVSQEDILLRRQELASDFDYYGSIGISYTFGSIYSNVINPRFGY